MLFLASDIAIVHSFALLGTNISPEKAILKMIFPFHKLGVGICDHFLEGTHQRKKIKRTCNNHHQNFTFIFAFSMSQNTQQPLLQYTPENETPGETATKKIT